MNSACAPAVLPPFLDFSVISWSNCSFFIVWEKKNERCFLKKLIIKKKKKKRGSSSYYFRSFVQFLQTIVKSIDISWVIKEYFSSCMIRLCFGSFNSLCLVAIRLAPRRNILPQLRAHLPLLFIYRSLLRSPTAGYNVHATYPLILGPNYKPLCVHFICTLCAFSISFLFPLPSDYSEKSRMYCCCCRCLIRNLNGTSRMYVISISCLFGYEWNGNAHVILGDGCISVNKSGV